MATATLVNSDIEIGRRIVAALTRASIPVTVYLWAFIPQLQEWQYMVATPLVDSKGPLAAYGEVNKALQNDGLFDDAPLRRIFLKSPDDPVLKSLEKESRAIPREAFRVVNEQIAGSFVEDAYVYGSAIVIESENIPRGGPSAYYVTYAPYSGSGAPPWIVTGLNDLRQLLARLHVDQDVVESIVEELSTNKRAAVIPNIRLRAQELKLLRQA